MSFSIEPSMQVFGGIWWQVPSPPSRGLPSPPSRGLPSPPSGGLGRFRLTQALARGLGHADQTHPHESDTSRVNGM